MLQRLITDEVICKFEAQPKVCPFSEKLLQISKKWLACEFQTQASGDGYETELIKQILSAANDPDRVVIPEWLEQGFPLGIAKPIVNTGVFPATDEVSAAIKMSAAIGTLHEDWDGSARNYSSFYEAGEKAQKELERLVQEGWAKPHNSWEEVTQEVGNHAIVTPLACIIKMKAGKEKVVASTVAWKSSKESFCLEFLT